MKTENSALLQMARESLQDRWGTAIAAFLIYFLMAFFSQFIPFIGSIGWFVVTGPFVVGLAIFSLSIARGKEARVEQIFDGFKKFEKALIAYLLMVIFVLLWMLLLIVPGIIASFAYSQTFFILADDDTIEPLEALKKSKEMMYGYKWKLFSLFLWFFLLSLLCILTLGIGFLWLMPYMQVTLAHFYLDLKGEWEEERSDGDLLEDLLDPM
jgi:uncharacterized membrane protein